MAEPYILNRKRRNTGQFNWTREMRILERKRVRALFNEWQNKPEHPEKYRRLFAVDEDGTEHWQMPHPPERQNVRENIEKHIASWNRNGNPKSPARGRLQEYGAYRYS